MPLYEYLCEACGRRTEALQRRDEAPLTECPHCQGKLRKLLAAPAFQFKGSGWYQTDYARKSGGGGDKGGETAPSSGGGETSSGAEASSGGGESAEKSPPPTAPASKPSGPGGDD